MKTRGPIGLAALALAGAMAPPATQAREPPGRENSLVVYGDDPCPRPSDDEEIVVCARQPEEERYRIPRELRDERERRTESSWTATNAALEAEQAYTRPNGCSPVGSFGQSGCLRMMLDQWLAERAARRPGR